MARPKNSKDKKKRKERTIWTHAQLQTLNHIYPDTTNEEIAKLLNKSIDSVKTRARILGLKKSEKFMQKYENYGKNVNG